MPAPAVRKLIWALTAALAVAVLIAIVLPFVASTQIVRTRIAQELSAWSGYRVTLGSPPEIEVWPSFSAVLSDVSFSTWSDPDRPPVLTAERVEAKLSSLMAIGGRVAFSKVKLERPVLRVARRGDFLYLPDSPQSGRLFDQIAAIGAGGGDPSGKALGSVSFIDGRVELIGADGPTELVSDIRGVLEWEDLKRPLSLNADGIWRGEEASVALFIEKPTALIAGEDTHATASLKADPLMLSFDGAARIAQRVRINGALKASSPSLRRTLEWSEAEITPGSAIGAISLKGKVEGDLERLRIRETELTLGNSPATGALEVALLGPAPSISGTLAFETLDIAAFLSAFTSSPSENGGWAKIIDLSFTDQFSLDVRLSAKNATGGRATLSDVAATAQVRSGLAAFDISDATGFGGNIQAGFRVDRLAGGDAGELRVTATGIDWTAIAALSDWTVNPPQAKGSASVVLKAPLTDWRALPGAISGKVSGKLEAGKIPGINLPALLKRIDGDGFFGLSEVSDGAIAIDGGEFSATLDKGAARLEKTSAWTAAETIRVAGIIPYVGKSLALSATILPRNTQNDRTRTFFAGGSWHAPFIVSTVPPLPQQ